MRLRALAVALALAFAAAAPSLAQAPEAWQAPGQGQAPPGGPQAQHQAQSRYEAFCLPDLQSYCPDPPVRLGVCQFKNIDMSPACRSAREGSSDQQEKPGG